MPLLFFSDILLKAGLDPSKVMLIRHSLANRGFKECYEKNMVYEYTCHQKSGFSRGYDYWAVFISGAGTFAKFFALYQVGPAVPDSVAMVPEGLPSREATEYRGDNEFFLLNPVELLKEYEGKLVIDWGQSTRMWHQKGSSEKPIISIQPDEKKIFSGFEDLVLSYDELKEIICNPTVYESWHSALSSVFAIYLIVDRENGKQYVGSAYGSGGLLSRWSCYVETRHGHNKELQKLICNYPERYHSFQFSILQILPKTLTADEVISIESRYKKKLLSKEFGMNAN